MTDPILREYFRSRDEALLREALDYALDWHRQHLAERGWGQSLFSWLGVIRARRAGEHPFVWYDMAVGIRAMRIAFFVDSVQRGRLAVDGEEMEALLELADAHSEELQVEHRIAMNNQGVFQTVGLHMLCSVMPERDSCAHGRAFASRMLNRVIDSQFTSQNVHVENSPDQHFMFRNLLRRLSAVRRMDAEVVDRIEEMEHWGPWLVFPNRAIARVGESSGRGPPLGADPDEPACLGERCYAVADLSPSGYAIVRSLPSEEEQSSMLFVTGMAHSYRRKHSDELSFELFEHGRFIFVDSGKYDGNRGDMRDYKVSASAHNTISLDDTTIGPREVRLTGSLLEPTEVGTDGFLIRGRVERPGHFQQDREILYDPGISLTITDTLTASGERTYVSSLHLAPDLEPQPTDSGFVVDLDDMRIRIELESEDCSLSSVRGQEDPLLGWHSSRDFSLAPISVLRAICPGQERQIVWNVSLQ